ncbi:hypothetical protein BMF94_6034 [Rhodotorula taiwanensis]|uniref:CAP-Gly domain-containing protein n=1 Tax=Rhodotorula taiwanensis TaxID=741276 RepID=A0A2S5B2G3_9BASI|nr:hypothetical protein BMF94_6034 [Rhodotorula taiwanensis]
MMRPPSTPARTPRRQSAIHTPGPVTTMLHVGQSVTFEVGGEPMTGTLRFVGPVDGKSGEWAGVQLDDHFAGRGKNDGSVQGQQYFACPPQCGLFLPLAKVQPRKRLEVEDLRPPTQQTPRPRPRPSLPTAVTPTRLASSTATPTRLAGPRSSIGSTPSALSRSSRASLGGTPAARRPPSRQQAAPPPEVPPIPSAYGLARSMTPSSATGRVTPALTRSETPRRRTSMAPPPPVERPVTPSLRSSSRQSFASSVSRQSHRSSLAGGGGEDASELRHLLDASERLGREMEDRLVEKSRRIKELEDAALERERRFEDRVRQLESEAEASQRQADQTRLEAEQRQHEASRSADSRQANERKHLAKEAEIESLRERLARANDEHARVAGDLQAEVDKLRKAGQALCETYEDKIAEIELARLEALDLVDELRRDRPPPLLEPAAEPKAAAAAVGGGAAAIDAENARAEVEHLRAKVATLEEQLEDVRAQLEQEIADARVRRHKAIEAETSLKDQIRAAQAETDSTKRERDRLASRVRELEAALSESQATLEAERSELETLREDSRGGEALTAVKADLDRSERETAQLTDLVARLREDLRQADRSSSSDAEVARLRRQLEETQRTSQVEIKALKAEVRRVTIRIRRRFGKQLTFDPREQITELESLVENKIYQEDELVSELETLRSGKPNSQEWCDDCEAFGHSLDNCPLASEVF